MYDFHRQTAEKSHLQVKKIGIELNTKKLEFPL
jgi:hypothetical protein